MTTVWTNWAGQQQCAPRSIERPASEAELADAVGRAVQSGATVRPIGSGHSFTDICCTDGCLIDQSRMNRLLDVDRSTRLVRVQAGIKLHRLAELLAEYGLALENQGDIDTQSLAGALATATHGTGARFRNLSANVVSCTLVTADGNATQLTADTDPDALLAARVSVGALGVISEYTLRCVPAFRIHRIDRRRSTTEVLEEMEALVDTYDHVEVLPVPHTDRCLTLTAERTDRPARPRGRTRAWIDDELVANHLLGAACRLGGLLPDAVPRIARTVSAAVGDSEQCDDSYRVYAHQRRVRFTEMEYAIPREHAAEATERIMAVIRDRRLPVLFPVEVRFTAPDDAFLSTAHGRDTAFVAVHQIPSIPYESYFRAVEEIMNDYQGRPHWGKQHYQTAAALAPRYPGWDRFQSVRARFDPQGAFTNDYVRRTLGPVTA